MSKPTDDRFTYELMMAEIEALKRPRRHHLALALDEHQEDYLLSAKPGQPDGVRWSAFLDWWKAQGWPGEKDALRRYYRRLEAERGSP